LALFVVYAAFFASLGIFISTTGRTAFWCHTTMAAALLVVFAGAYITVHLVRAPQNDFRDVFLTTGTNPLLTQWSVCFSWSESAGLMDDLPSFRNLIWSSLASLAVFGFLGWLLWKWTCIKFRHLLESDRHLGAAGR
jgi:hypothetical protein